MTEEEWWLACCDPEEMLESPQCRKNPRKVILFTCACCRCVPERWDQKTCDQIELAERFAGTAMRVDVHLRFKDFGYTVGRFHSGAVARGGAIAQAKTINRATLRTHFEDSPDHEFAVRANILRDIFGNPFRPVAFNPAWHTSDVLLLAQGIYDDRAFDRMPILADALQDAGCDNEDVLNHCREVNATHVRGCWVVDLVLGKQ